MPWIREADFDNADVYFQKLKDEAIEAKRAGVTGEELAVLEARFHAVSVFRELIWAERIQLANAMREELGRRG